MKLDKDDLTLITQLTRECEKRFNDAKCASAVLFDMCALDSINYNMLPKSIADTLCETTDYFVMLAYFVFPNDFRDSPIDECFDSRMLHVDLALRLMTNRTTGHEKLTALELITEKIDAGVVVPEGTAATLFAFEHALDRIINKGVNK